MAAYLLLNDLDPLPTPRLWRVHPLNLTRIDEGEYQSLVVPMRNYPQKFYEYFRMVPQKFDRLLEYLEDFIRKEDTNFGEAIAPEVRLAICLR